MNARRLLAVARKEILHVRRDPRSLGMGIAIPVLMLVLFGSALALDVDRVPLVVWDQSRTPESRDIVGRFTASRYFSERGRAGDARAVARALDEGDALVALVVPADFGARVSAGRPAAVQVLVDGSDSSTATRAIGYAEAVVDGYGRDVLSRAARSAGRPAPFPPLDVRARVWFNPDLESRQFIVPGLIAVIMMVIAALLTSLTVAREWETGTMEQLCSTPVKRSELILGKLAPYFAIGMTDVCLAVLMGTLLFGVPLRGSAALLFSFAAVFLVGALGLGMLVSILARSQLVANQLAMTLTFLPAFLLSGFTFAIANMPAPIQALTRAIPARYFVTALKGIFLKGVGLEVLAFEAALLVLFAAFVLAFAHWRFKKKLA